MVGKGCLLFSFIIFDRKGVSIFIVFSFHIIVTLEYLDRVGRKLDGFIYFILAYTPS